MHSIKKPNILLASESPYRKAQLESLGVPFTTARPLIDEEREKKSFQEPATMAQGLARLKALSLKKAGHLVIGGDQLIHFEGKVLGKPKTFERAVEQLKSLQGKTHEILTAFCVVTENEIIEHLDRTKMTLKSLNDQEIHDYVEKDQPLDCAGSYKIEKNGHQLFLKIETQDFSAIQGLPLLKLSEILQTYGYVTKKIKDR